MKVSNKVSNKNMSRAHDQFGAASGLRSDAPPRTHVSEKKVSTGNENDIADINRIPSRIVPPSPAAELGTGHLTFNGAGSATFRLRRTLSG